MKLFYIFFISIILSLGAFAQRSTGINNQNPSPKASLDVMSSSNVKQGILIPRLCTGDTAALQIDITNKEKGLLFYDTCSTVYRYWNGTKWSQFSNSNGVTVSNIATGTGLTGGPITTTGTISLANTAVTAASYGSATQVGRFTVDAQGRLTAASDIAITGLLSGGTPNYLPKWSSATGLSSTSLIYDDGTNVGIGITLPVSKFSVGASSQFQVDASGNIVKLNDVPTSFPTSNAIGVLTNNGTGTLTWAAGSSGTVSSVALSLPTFITVTGSPITTSGILTGTLASQTANTVFIAPDGAAGAPSFRSLVANDIPNISATKITSGILPIANGGTGASSLGSAGAIPRMGATTLIASNISDNGSLVSIGSGINVIPTTAQGVNLAPFAAGIGSTSELRFGELAVNGAQYVGFKAPDAITTSQIYVLPATSTSGSLKNDGAGNLSWSTASSGWGLTGNAGTTSATNFIGTTDDHSLRFRTNNLTRLHIDSITGHVGIGTNSPNALLSVNGGGFAGTNYIHFGGHQRIRFSSPSVNPFLSIENLAGGLGIKSIIDFNNLNTGSALKSSVRLASQFTENTAGGEKGAFTIEVASNNVFSEKLRILSTGNVGIGAIIPTEVLDVVGNVKFSGALMPNNLPGTFGQVLTSAGAGSAPTWTNVGSQACPANMISPIGNTQFCIDNAEQGALMSFWLASKACIEANKRLCTLTEWVYSCQNLGVAFTSSTDDYEWVEFGGLNSSHMVGNGSCITTATDAFANPHVFRCCFSR